MQAKPGWVILFATIWLALSMIMALSPPVSQTGRGSASQPIGALCAVIALALIVFALRAIWWPPDPDSAKAQRSLQLAQANRARSVHVLSLSAVVLPPVGAGFVIMGITEHNRGLWSLGGMTVLWGVTSGLLARMLRQ
jgi:hypothetical protein